MRNGEYIRNLTIRPAMPESSRFVWSVDIAYPSKDSKGNNKFIHWSHGNEEVSFSDAMTAATKYIEGI